MYNIVNQLGQRDFSYGPVANNLEDRKHLSDQMNRKDFNPNPAKCDWSCYTM